MEVIVRKENPAATSNNEGKRFVNVYPFDLMFGVCNTHPRSQKCYITLVSNACGGFLWILVFTKYSLLHTLVVIQVVTIVVTGVPVLPNRKYRLRTFNVLPHIFC